jgi:hypothetical protein
MMAFTPWTPGVSVSHFLALLPDGCSASLAEGTLTIDGCTQQDLDTALVTFTTDTETHQVMPVREMRRKALVKSVADFVETRYPSHLREMFTMLMLEAAINSQANRIAYIASLLSWIKEAAALSIAAEADLDAAADLQQVRDVTIDFSQVAASDPAVTVKMALMITN